ncbi:hypothetical protein HELRODRAFT_189042 [Helobdella robusta]|uniref:HAP1 N-terminal domain-containing protein n=1 Tax=Helobdella robusta TaxID=6412 RepID=T1FQL1_HELRO|nr:hypothetical protein HELRODRAFT_189042 [Helobdella robusta]ESN99241.1 hypothetical protein HELRODRAFT_189042 [Helobdella robusta]
MDYLLLQFINISFHEQKDEGLNLTAKIGKKLLLITHDLSHKNDHLTNEVHDLRDELNQLKYSQTPRGRSFQLCEELDNETDVNNNEYDDDDVDEGTSCSVGQKIMNNWRLNGSVNQQNSMTTMSSSLEETYSLRRQIDQLNSNNNMLRDEVKMLQQQSQEDFQQLKECYNVEFGNAKKLINNLERRIESGELRFGKFEQEALVWKNSVEMLANKCNKHEVEIDVLQEEISKIKTIQNEDKKAMQQLVKENKELRELIDSLKDRVHQMEQTKHPKVLRHVTDSKSPYVDSMSFAQELEKTRTENVNCLLSQQSSNFLCKSSPNIHQISNPHPPNNFFFKLKRMLGWSHLKLGQPGRPGSSDLDLAVSHLKTIETSRVNSHRKSKFMSKNVPPNSLKLKHSNKAHTSGFNQSVKFHGFREQYNEDFSPTHVQDVPFTTRNLFSPSSTSSSTSHNPGSGYLTTPSSAVKTGPQNFPLFRSRQLQEWMVLGTPDLSQVLRRPSGVWLKGSGINDFFIEENFSKILSEAEDDDEPATLHDDELGRGSGGGGEPSCSGFNMNFSHMLRDDYDDSNFNNPKFVGISKNICDVSGPKASNKFFITNKPRSLDFDTNVNTKTKANIDAVSSYNIKFNELKLNCKENSSTNIIEIFPKNTSNKALHSPYVKIVSKPSGRINAVRAISDIKEHSSASVENIDSIPVFQNNKKLSNNRSTSLSDISHTLSKSLSNIFAGVKNNFIHNVMDIDKTASAQLFDLSSHQFHSPPLAFSKRLSESTESAASLINPMQSISKHKSSQASLIPSSQHMPHLGMAVKINGCFKSTKELKNSQSLFDLQVANCDDLKLLKKEFRRYSLDNQSPRSKETFPMKPGSLSSFSLPLLSDLSKRRNSYSGRKSSISNLLLEHRLETPVRKVCPVNRSSVIKEAKVHEHRRYFICKRKDPLKIRKFDEATKSDEENKEPSFSPRYNLPVRKVERISRKHKLRGKFS